MGLKTKIITNFLIFIIILAPSNLFAQTSFKTAPKIISSPRIIPITTDSRIKTLVYNANEVFQLKFHYGYQSFIEFSDDEETEMISIGESFAWRLTPAGKRLFIRPLEIGAHTNLTLSQQNMMVEPMKNWSTPFAFIIQKLGLGYQFLQNYPDQMLDLNQQ
jgi:hypothetical protein